MNKIFSNYIYGVQFVPLVPIAWEASNQVAKAFGLMKSTFYENFSDEFQANMPDMFDFVVPSQGIQRLAMRQVVFLMSNQLMPLFEEFVFSTVLQYGLFTALPSKISDCMQKKPRKKPRKPVTNVQQNTSSSNKQNAIWKKVSRIVASSVLFGFAHYGQSYMMETERARFSMDQLGDRNLQQVTGAFGAGLVYRTVYELSGQCLFAAWGTHALYNYLHDAITYDFWY